MSRILAIDYGRKRTGIAVTDPMQIIANGLTTVPTHELMDFLLKYVAQEKVERIVVGHPKQMNNEDSENMKYIKPFVAQLKKKLPDMPVELMLRPSRLSMILLDSMPRMEMMSLLSPMAALRLKDISGSRTR